MTKIFGIAKENRDDLLLDFSWRAPSVSIHDAWFWSVGLCEGECIWLRFFLKLLPFSPQVLFIFVVNPLYLAKSGYIDIFRAFCLFSVFLMGFSLVFFYIIITVGKKNSYRSKFLKIKNNKVTPSPNLELSNALIAWEGDRKGVFGGLKVTKEMCFCRVCEMMAYILSKPCIRNKIENGTYKRGLVHKKHTYQITSPIKIIPKMKVCIVRTVG